MTRAQLTKLTVPQYPPIGSRVRCLAAPPWSPPETAAAMAGQIGEVTNHFPADSEDCSDAIGIQYPVSPYSDNTIAQDLTLEGQTWERIA